MTFDDISDVVNLCRFMDYNFSHKVDGRGCWYIQGEYWEADIHTGVNELQRTRRWFTSPEVVPGEIVQTVFKCALTSMEHRSREHFLYKGRRVFGPHFDIEQLWSIAETARLERSHDGAGERT